MGPVLISQEIRAIIELEEMKQTHVPDCICMTILVYSEFLEAGKVIVIHRHKNS